MGKPSELTIDAVKVVIKKLDNGDVDLCIHRRDGRIFGMTGVKGSPVEATLTLLTKYAKDE